MYVTVKLKFLKKALFNCGSQRFSQRVSGGMKGAEVRERLLLNAAFR
jgi:hypothetical protein